MSTPTAELESIVAPARDGQARWRGWWLTTCLVAVLLTAFFTWPLALHLGSVWRAELTDPPLPNSPPVTRYGASDGLQTAYVQTQVLDNLRHLREPYLDLDEGAAGPAPLRTTSLDTPWVALTALVWPLFGLAAAYNLMLLLSSALTVVAAMGLFRRHTRWPLLALAGAVVYAFVPYRMIQLTGHFNAVLWWALPAAAWAFEVMLERHRNGDRWTVPGAWLVAVTLLVALSGEFHLTLYVSGLVLWLTIWSLAGAARGAGAAGVADPRGRGAGAAGVADPRVPSGRRSPWVPLGVAVGATVAGCLYAVLAFRWAFRGGVAGPSGKYGEVIHYAPRSLDALVHKIPGANAEGYIYMGWPVVVLAAAGLALALWRRPGARAYAVLAPLLLLLTYGPTSRKLAEKLGVHGFDPYRPIVDAIPFLKLQRVTGRIMVLTAMVLVLLAVVALDGLGRWLSSRAAWLPRVGALLLIVATLSVLGDYRVLGGAIGSAQDGNQVVRTLARSGDQAGPFLGLPVKDQAYPVNSATTFLAAQSRRSTLNAYNQTAAPWLATRNQQLAPLNQGKVTDGALAVLRATGTRQVVVVDEPNTFKPGQSRALVDRLLASGHFRLVVEDNPLTLLTFTG